MPAPTRVAIITDGHADARALDAVLAAIDQAGIERIWCLGDFCSGGGEPVECFERTLEACEIVLAGNHELFVTHEIWHRTDAAWAQAAQFASEELGPDRVATLRGLHCHTRRSEAELVHAALTDPAMDFLRGPRDAQRNFTVLDRPLLLFGHTHVAACWAPDVRAGARRGSIDIGARHRLPAEAEDLRLLNPGAVCDASGARWLELELAAGHRYAVWHQEATGGHGGIASWTPVAEPEQATGPSRSAGAGP